MCIPTPRAEAAPASTIPSMQAANDLVLPGDAGRGAAQVGRLQLRAFAGFPAPTVAPGAHTPETSGAAAPTPAPSAPSGITPPVGTSPAQALGVPFTAANRTLSPNLNLRLGAIA